MEHLAGSWAVWAAYLAAFAWGGVWAAFHQFTAQGRFMSKRHTWLTVVSGVGGDLLIAFFVLNRSDWQIMAAIVGFSSFFVAVRAIVNDQKRMEDEYKAIKELTGEILHEKARRLRRQSGFGKGDRL